MRRLTTHQATNFDGEQLQVLILWEEGVNKETIKKELRYCKTTELLINRGSFYEYIEKKACNNP